MCAKRNAIEDFWKLVDRGSPDACWNWTGNVWCGYGMYGLGGKCWRVHRLSYTELVGDIPEGLTLDHLCRNKRCVNPAHLEPVTAAVNTMRGNAAGALNAAKTECKWGHPLSGDNLYLAPTTGARICLECKRLRRQRIRDNSIKRKYQRRNPF